MLSYNWQGFQAWDTLQESTDNASVVICGDSFLSWTKDFTSFTKSADFMQTIPLLPWIDIYVNFPSLSPGHFPWWMCRSKHKRKSKRGLSKSFTVSSCETLLWHIRELGLRDFVNGKYESFPSVLIGSWMSMRLCSHTELKGYLHISPWNKYTFVYKTNVAITFGSIVVETSVWRLINT